MSSSKTTFVTEMSLYNILKYPTSWLHPPIKDNSYDIGIKLVIL